MKKLIISTFCLIYVSAYCQKVEIPKAISYNADALIAKGISLHEEKKLDSAIYYYDLIHERDPQYLFAMYEKSLTLSAQSKHKEALALLEDIAQKHDLSMMPSIYIEYGSSLDNNNQMAKADSVFEVAKKYIPDCSSIYFNQSIVKIKQNKKQEAIDLIKKTITLDPNKSSAYYFLGLLAMEDGQLSIGSLCLLSYLTIKPDGRYARDVINILNSKIGQKYDVKSVLKIKDTDDDFSELEDILKNQLALNKKYKLNFELDDNMPRHIQAITEYAKTHKVKDGYFEKKFIPYLSHISSQNLTENYTYYTLASITDGKIGSMVSKKKNQIEAFVKSLLAGNFWNTFAQRKDIYGQKGNVIVYYENGVVNQVGPVVNGKKEGEFVELNKDGNVVLRNFYKNGINEGLLKKYNKDGKLTEECMYKADKKDGKEKFYSVKPVNVLGEATYKDGMLQGPYVIFFHNGGKKFETNFVNDKIEGNLTYYYSDGKIKDKFNYKNGIVDGKAESYNEVGDLTKSATYLDGYYNGDVIEYYDGKKIKLKQNYKNGNLLNEASFHPNGSKKSETIIGSDKTRTRISYDQLDNKTFLEVFDEKFNIISTTSYDHDGKIEFEQEFDKEGNVKMIRQHSNSSPKPIEVKTKNGKATFRYRNGMIASQGSFSKSKKQGEWTYYYPNGKIKTKSTFIDDKENGVTTNYDKFGFVSSIYPMIDDRICGKYTTFSHGKVRSIFHYDNGNYEGPFEKYSSEGKLEEHGLLSENDYTSIKELHENGEVYNELQLSDHEMIYSIKYFDQNKKLLSEFDYENKNGEFEIASGVVTNKTSLINGQTHGPLTSIDASGTKLREMVFANGKSHGISNYFNPSGTPSLSQNNYCNKENGTSLIYNQDGSLRGKNTYHFGDASGKAERYYKSGKLFLEYTNLNNEYHGENKYYNQDGDIVMKVYFLNDFITAYAHLDNGKWSDKIWIDTNAVKITSTNSSGKVLCTMNIKNMLLNGQVSINSSNGSKNYEANYLSGELHGLRDEYHANGKIHKHESFQYGVDHGKSEYFAEDGSQVLSVEYQDDNYHGDYTIYKNGKKDTIKKYVNNNLMKIQKL